MDSDDDFQIGQSPMMDGGCDCAGVQGGSVFGELFDYNVKGVSRVFAGLIIVAIILLAYYTYAGYNSLANMMVVLLPILLVGSWAAETGTARSFLAARGY